MYVAFLLIALGFGYKIYVEASKQTKTNLKRLGRIIGIFIMAVAFMGTLCKTWSTIKYGGYGCPHSRSYLGKKYCPLGGLTGKNFFEGSHTTTPAK